MNCRNLAESEAKLAMKKGGLQLSGRPQCDLPAGVAGPVPCLI
jgi:hypothetical protein